MNNTEIYNILSNLGYQLQDRGEYWQCPALFRGGDNPTALQIYKNTGVWKDYVTGDSFLPFQALLQKTPGGESIINNKSNFELPTNKIVSKDAKINLEKTFPQNLINDLLPHYDFYKSKGISPEILSFLKSGLCTGGSMYQRYVFPIYNKYGQIHGLAGRDLSNLKGRPKWKHMGKKTKWIYPLYVLDQDRNSTVLSSIISSKEVILVESIGDLLACLQNKIYNVLVTFGVDISPSMLSVLLGLNLNSIIISFNNDENKKENAGQQGAIKNFLKLLSFFPEEKLHICLPVKNDFGDMNKKDFELWLKKKKNNQKQNQIICKKVLDFSKNMFKNKKLSSKIYSNIKKLSCYE